MPPLPPTSPRMTATEERLWSTGQHFKAWRHLGAHPTRERGRRGVHFAVWAPNAAEVSVLGDFNGWVHGQDPLTFHPPTGIWRGFLPGLGRGDLYKYSLRTREGALLEKADPYAFASERRPQTASVVWGLPRHTWRDEAWLARRQATVARAAPLNIYEVHLGSWRRVPEEGGRWLSYQELAPALAAYCLRMGYTHVELLPLTEHPFDGSWGYQTLGYFAPTRRYGPPEALCELIDTLHRAGVGVILDWVPAHFPTDGHGLDRFDGTALYEHEDPREGFHPHWRTRIFNYGRHEVRDFLISSARFWLEVYHVDGLRVDAVASMLYRDYGREPGGWIPNHHGGRENLQAIRLLQDLNRAVTAHHPGCFTMAEESTAWGQVTGPIEQGGLGFTFKWNMGWMHDTLRYMEQDPLHRRHHHQRLTFGMLYQYSEAFLLPLSHDEVVHGKGSLLGKMPGDDWQRRASLRVLLAYKTGYPGKKLLFMGGEWGQPREWDHDGSLDWHLLEQPGHAGLHRWVRHLNHLYRRSPALWTGDADPRGFRWIQCHEAAWSLVTFARLPVGEPSGHPETARPMVFACHFTPVPRPGYRMGVPEGGAWRVRLNSDHPCYGGAGAGPQPGQTLQAEPLEWDGQPWSVLLDLPPLGAVILEGPDPSPRLGAEPRARGMGTPPPDLSAEGPPPLQGPSRSSSGG